MDVDSGFGSVYATAGLINRQTNLQMEAEYSQYAGNSFDARFMFMSIYESQEEAGFGWLDIDVRGEWLSIHVICQTQAKPFYIQPITIMSYASCLTTSISTINSGPVPLLISIHRANS